MQFLNRFGWRSHLALAAITLGIVFASTSPSQAHHPMGPVGPGVRGPVYNYGFGFNCANCPQVPTTRTIRNNLWQSKQWKGEYPVCQPLYAPNFGHFQTKWNRFPGDECFDSPSMAVRPF